MHWTSPFKYLIHLKTPSRYQPRHGIISAQRVGARNFAINLQGLVAKQQVPQQYLCWCSCDVDVTKEDATILLTEVTRMISMDEITVQELTFVN